MAVTLLVRGHSRVQLDAFLHLAASCYGDMNPDTCVGENDENDAGGLAVLSGHLCTLTDLWTTAAHGRPVLSVWMAQVILHGGCMDDSNGAVAQRVDHVVQETQEPLRDLVQRVIANVHKAADAALPLIKGESQEAYLERCGFEMS